MVALLAGALAFGTARAVDPTWNYAVQATASVSRSPAEIRLRWLADPTAPSPGYRPRCTVARKAATAATWGPRMSIPPGQLEYVDGDVSPGAAYEYEIIREFADPAAPGADHTAFGYVLAGIDVPFADHRGRVILVVEDRVADALGGKVARLRSDLVGDGWSVAEIRVSAHDSPAGVRQRIRDQYYLAADRADMLLLLGHVPVVKSGLTAPDSHELRPLPADGFYADVDGRWTDANGDGVYDDDVLPSDVELGAGRVDFSDLGGIGSGLDDIGLTERYLDKDHAFRNGQLTFASRGLIGDRVGIDDGRAPAGNACGAFSALFGPGNVFEANVEDNARDDERWVSRLQAESYAWAFGSGGGNNDSVSYLGTRPPYKLAFSADVAAGAQGGFCLLFGSHFVDWAQPDNLLRSTLASARGGLGAGWSGRPNVIVHRMALGEPIGTGIRLTFNNETRYYSPPNAFRRGVHIAWMGDPTLRLDYPAPPGALSGAADPGGLELRWAAPSDGAPAYYAVYRAFAPEGLYTRLGTVNGDETAFIDRMPAKGTTYMVRAVRRQQTASGTYEDPSTGVFWTNDGVVAPTEPPPPVLEPNREDLLVNLSTRLHFATGESERAPVVGFVVPGSGARRILVRVVGPGLGAFGISNPLPDPTLRLVDAQGALVADSSGWTDDAAIVAAGERVGAFPLDYGSRDAAVVVMVPPGNYTAHVGSANSGEVLIEAYDASVETRQLSNLSTRAYVGRSDDLIAGFVVGGSSARRVLVRGIGPTLGVFGVGGALPDPLLQVFDANRRLIARNDQWSTPEPVPGGPSPATGSEIADADARTGAFALPSGSGDAAVLLTLEPGAYTAAVSAADGAEGIALVEAYQVP